MSSQESKHVENPSLSADVGAGSRRIEYGEATEMWLELEPYPKSSAASLWLLVKGRWLSLDKPPVDIQNAVQSAFCHCPDRLQVLVWYYEQPVGSSDVPANTDPRELELDRRRGSIEGLVIRSK